MKRIIVFLLFLLLFPNYINAYESSASSVILMDMDNNVVIYEKNSHNVRSVASISKIMTAIVALENKDINDKVVIGEEITKAYGSGIYIKQGETMTLGDLLYGLMLRSGNDASLAIAKYVGESVDNFVDMMNKKAIDIGMKDTKFNNPNGLDENGGNQSSAYDMAILTSYAMKNDIYRKIVSTKKYTLKTDMNYYSWVNKHKLLHSYKYATGGKTGFTEVAKRTLVTTASKDNINLVVVTLNDGNDFKDHVNLFEEAFNNYTNYNILKEGNIKIPNEVYYNKDTLYIKNNYSKSLPNSKNNEVLLNYKIEKKDNYVDGDVIGKIEVIVNNEKVHDENIYIKKVQKLSFKDKIVNWFKNLW